MTVLLPPLVAASATATVVTDSLGREWDSHKHPRGRDGKFIRTFHLVRSFLHSGDTDPWMTGQVVQLNNDGSIRVKINKITNPANAIDPHTHQSYVGHEVDVQPDSIESINEKAVLNGPSTNPAGIGAHSFDFNVPDMESFYKNAELDKNDQYAAPGTKKAEHLATIADDYKTGKVNSLTVGDKYDLALYAFSKSSDSPDDPNEHEQFRNLLSELGVPDDIVDDTPDGASGLQWLADKVNAGRAPNKSIPESADWLKEAAPLHPNTVREATLFENPNIRLGWFKDGSKGFIHSDGSVEKYTGTDFITAAHLNAKGDPNTSTWVPNNLPDHSGVNLPDQSPAAYDQKLFPASESSPHSTKIHLSDGIPDSAWTMQNEDSVSEYLNDEMGINGFLRTGSVPPGYADHTPEKFLQQIDDIDKIIAHGNIPAGTQLWRGLSVPPEKHEWFHQNLVPGNIVHDAGFMSTTTDQHKATFFSKLGHTTNPNRISAVVKLNTPNDFHGISIDTHPDLLSHSESEVLGARDWSYRIDKVAKVGDNEYQIEATLLPESHNGNTPDASGPPESHGVDTGSGGGPEAGTGTHAPEGPVPSNDPWGLNLNPVAAQAVTPDNFDPVKSYLFDFDTTGLPDDQYHALPELIDAHGLNIEGTTNEQGTHVVTVSGPGANLQQFYQEASGSHFNPEHEFWKNLYPSEHNDAPTSPVKDSFDPNGTYELQMPKSSLGYGESMDEDFSAISAIEDDYGVHVTDEDADNLFVTGEGDKLQQLWNDHTSRQEADDFYHNIEKHEPVAKSTPQPEAPVGNLPGPESNDWQHMHDDQGEYRWDGQGNKLRIGDEVTGADGKTFTVHKFEANNKGVVVKDAAGKKYARHRLKLTKTTKNAPAPEPKPAPSTPAPDTTSKAPIAKLDMADPKFPADLSLVLSNLSASHGDTIDIGSGYSLRYDEPNDAWNLVGPDGSTITSIPDGTGYDVAEAINGPVAQNEGHAVQSFNWNDGNFYKAVDYVYHIPDDFKVDVGDGYKVSRSSYGDWSVFNPNGDVISFKNGDGKISSKIAQEIHDVISEDVAGDTPAFDSKAELAKINDIPKTVGPIMKQHGIDYNAAKSYRNASYALDDAAKEDVGSPEWNKHVDRALKNIKGGGPKFQAKYDEVAAWRQKSLDAKNGASAPPAPGTADKLPPGYASIPEGGHVYAHAPDTGTYVVEDAKGKLWYYYIGGTKNQVSGLGVTKESIKNSGIWTLIDNPDTTPDKPATPPSAPEKTGPHRIGADGNKIFVGDKVKSTTDGQIYTVHKFENNDVGVVVVDQNGKKYARNRKKLISVEQQPQTTAAPQTSAPNPPVPQSSPKPVFEPDPSSPWFGEDKKPVPPVKPAELTPESWVPADWLQKAEENWKAKSTNPGKGFQNTIQYAKWKKVADEGNLASLDALNQEGFITPELYKEAKDSLDEINAKNSVIEDKYSADLKQYSADMKAWNQANGIDPLAFPGAPKNATEPFLGGTPNWNQSHPGTPSGAAVLDAMNNADPNLAERGSSILTDADEIEDMDVRVMRVIEFDGNQKLEGKFKLTSWAADALLPQLQAKGAKTHHGIHLKDRTHDPVTGLPKYTNTDKYTYPGTTYSITDPETGIRFDFYRAHDGKTKLAEPAVHNEVRMWMPVGTTPEQYQHALSYFGIKNAAPARPEDIQTLAKNKLVSVAGGSTDPTKNFTGADLEQRLANIKSKYGLTVNDMHLGTDAKGRIKFFLSDEARDKMQKYSNIHGFTHNVSSSHSLDTWTKLLIGPNAGLNATHVRWSEGLGGHGMSSGSDMNSGGGDYVYLRPMHKTPTTTSSSGGTIVMHPKAAMRRLDMYGNQTDNGTGKHYDNTHVYDLMKGNPYEIVYKHGVPVADMWYVTLPNSVLRNELIQALKNKGIDEINGVPVEEFVLGPNSPIPAHMDESQWSSVGIPPALENLVDKYASE